MSLQVVSFIFLKRFVIFVLCICVCTCMSLCALCACGYLRRQEGIRCPRTSYRRLCSDCCGCWEAGSSSLQEYQVLLATMPSLQLPQTFSSIATALQRIKLRISWIASKLGLNSICSLSWLQTWDSPASAFSVL